MSKRGRRQNRLLQAHRKAREARDAAGPDIWLISHLRERSITDCLPEWLGHHHSEVFNSITVLHDSENEPTLCLVNEFAVESVAIATGEPMPSTLTCVSPDKTRRYLVYRMPSEQRSRRLQPGCMLAGVLWDDGYQCAVRPAERFEDSLSDLLPWRGEHDNPAEASCVNAGRKLTPFRRSKIDPLGGHGSSVVLPGTRPRSRFLSR